nr:immunoglobulin heavy chain junction region [Mus musculus]
CARWYSNYGFYAMDYW